ncbi:hypothetical protein Q3G72_035446 [Acer saccharum]|nr:hypothetical protein Q3G72_035446 [Acer saccharum]
MGFSANKLMILIVVTASMLVTVSVANKDWYEVAVADSTTLLTGYGDLEMTPTASIAQSTQKDHLSGLSRTTPSFYVNDVLVLKYDPLSKSPFKHSVYLLPNMWSYLTCDLSKAKLIATTTQGSGEGFKYVLKKWKPYYFACGEHEGIHCRDGGMKFFVMPMLRRWHY